MPPADALDNEPRQFDADYLTLSPADFDALIARYKAINAAATNFARLLDETGWGIDAGNLTCVNHTIEPNGVPSINARCPGVSTLATASN
jgi:hypothetical protein